MPIIITTGAYSVEMFMAWSGECQPPIGGESPVRCCVITKNAEVAENAEVSQRRAGRSAGYIRTPSLSSLSVHPPSFALKLIGADVKPRPVSESAAMDVCRPRIAEIIPVQSFNPPPGIYARRIRKEAEIAC